jgi:hypothetical protein
MSNIGNGRVLRVCDLCGQVDDHPRHVIAGSEAGKFPLPVGDMARLVMQNSANLSVEEQNRLLTDLIDTSSSDRHLDCCATAGCPTNTCGPQVADGKGKTGTAMLNHLTSIEDRFTARPDVVTGV